jgi:hypothetical protein
LNSRVGGTISHNNVNGITNANIVTQQIQEAFEYDFYPTGVFISTWNRLPHFGTPGNLVS